MPELVAMIQTTWPKIRVGLYKRDDGRFQYIEEGLHADEDGGESWIQYNESDLYDDIIRAKADMVRFYCELVEDEYVVDPQSVTILELPDFKGPHHPRLLIRRYE
ncbi:MAG: hypothetical protein ABSC92_07045 [Rhizomicrobium sp.]|jgi:hypothetical protein